MSIETTQEHAMRAALQTADKTGISQTVFRNADTCGWWYTHPFATVLGRSELFVTILPERWFQP